MFHKNHGLPNPTTTKLVSDQPQETDRLFTPQQLIKSAIPRNTPIPIAKLFDDGPLLIPVECSQPDAATPLDQQVVSDLRSEAIAYLSRATCLLEFQAVWNLAFATPHLPLDQVKVFMDKDKCHPSVAEEYKTERLTKTQAHTASQILRPRVFKTTTNLRDSLAQIASYLVSPGSHYVSTSDGSLLPLTRDTAVTSSEIAAVSLAPLRRFYNVEHLITLYLDLLYYSSVPQGTYSVRSGDEIAVYLLHVRGFLTNDFRVSVTKGLAGGVDRSARPTDTLGPQPHDQIICDHLRLSFNGAKSEHRIEDLGEAPVGTAKVTFFRHKTRDNRSAPPSLAGVAMMTAAGWDCRLYNVHHGTPGHCSRDSLENYSRLTHTHCLGISATTLEGHFQDAQAVHAPYLYAGFDRTRTYGIGKFLPQVMILVVSVKGYKSHAMCLESSIPLYSLERDGLQLAKGDFTELGALDDDFYEDEDRSYWDAEDYQDLMDEFSDMSHYEPEDDDDIPYLYLGPQASSNSCTCTGTTTITQAVCAVPCGFSNSITSTGVTATDKCEPVGLMIVDSAREVYQTGKEGDLKQAAISRTTMLQYTQIFQTQSRALLYDIFALREFDIDKVQYGNGQKCFRTYSFSPPKFNGVTYPQYSTQVNDVLQGTTFLLYNSAGSEFQYYDLGVLTQLPQTPVVIFDQYSRLYSEFLTMSSTQSKHQMTSAMFEYVSSVINFSFQSWNRSLTSFGINPLKTGQQCDALITANGTFKTCPTFQPCTNQSMWYVYDEFHYYYHASPSCMLGSMLIDSRGTGFLEYLNVTHGASCNFTVGTSFTWTPPAPSCEHAQVDSVYGIAYDPPPVMEMNHTSPLDFGFSKTQFAIKQVTILVAMITASCLVVCFARCLCWQRACLPGQLRGYLRRKFTKPKTPAQAADEPAEVPAPIPVIRDERFDSFLN